MATQTSAPIGDVARFVADKLGNRQDRPSGAPPAPPAAQPATARPSPVPVTEAGLFKAVEDTRTQLATAREQVDATIKGHELSVQAYGSARIAHERALRALCDQFYRERNEARTALAARPTGGIVVPPLPVDRDTYNSGLESLQIVLMDMEPTVDADEDIFKWYTALEEARVTFLRVAVWLEQLERAQGEADDEEEPIAPPPAPPAAAAPSLPTTPDQARQVMNDLPSNRAKREYLERYPQVRELLRQGR